MAYTTPAAVRLALAPDGDTSPSTAASLSDGELGDAITEAQAEIDGRITGDPFPDNQAPAIVQTVTRDIAAYLATLTHRRGEPLDPNDPVRLRYQRAQTILTDMAAGRLEIPTQPSIPLDNTVLNLYDGDLFTLADAGISPRPPGWRPPAAPSPLGWPYGY